MSQKTGLSVNELIGAVNKGAPALREFGFSFGESAALVGQLDAAGLNAEKMLKGPLNTALVTLRKEGKTGADGLRGIVDQIQALLAAGDQLGARGLAEKYFGTKGATDFFDAIRSGNLDLANLSTSLQATSTDINKLAQDTGDGAERFQLLRSRIEKALEPLGTTVFDSVNAGLDKLAGWVESHQAQIVGAFVTIGDAVISMATGTLRGLGEMTEAFGGFIGILGDVEGAVLKLESAQARWRGDTAQADELHRQSEEAFGWGENIAKLGRDMKETARKGGEWKTSLHDLGEEAKNAAAATATLNRTVVDGKQVFGPFVGSPFISGTPSAAPAAAASSSASTAAAPAAATAPASLDSNLPAVDAALLANVPAGRYTQDLTLRQDLTKGLADCSSAVEDLVNIMDGRPTAGSGMSTGNEAEWLTARGFQPGMGGPGDFRVGFNAGHTQATLPGGTPFNWGSDPAAAKRGIGGTGADDPAFTSHFFRRVTPGLASTDRPASKPTSKPGLSTQGPNSPIDLSRNTITVNSVSTDGNKSATKTTGGGLKMPSLTSLSGIGSALGEFAGGQIGSALDVFGVGDSPGWLQAVGQFMGGISIGGGSGGDALSPLSALGQSGPAPSLTGAHGGTGAQPGPAVTYNIAARDTEDAFIRAQRQERERSASLLARF
jgi:hypothetical protein